MHQQVEDIDRTAEGAVGKHLEFFPDMRFRKKRRESQRQGNQHRDAEGDFCEKVAHKLAR